MPNFETSKVYVTGTPSGSATLVTASTGRAVGRVLPLVGEEPLGAGGGVLGVVNEAAVDHCEVDVPLVARQCQ